MKNKKLTLLLAAVSITALTASVFISNNTNAYSADEVQTTQNSDYEKLQQLENTTGEEIIVLKNNTDISKVKLYINNYMGITINPADSVESHDFIHKGKGGYIAGQPKTIKIKMQNEQVSADTSANILLTYTEVQSDGSIKTYALPSIYDKNSKTLTIKANAPLNKNLAVISFSENRAIEVKDSGEVVVTTKDGELPYTAENAEKAMIITRDDNGQTTMVAPPSSSNTKKSSSSSSSSNTSTTTTEAPTTSEAPAATSEAPATTSEAPAATSEAPATTSEAPAATSEAPAATSEAPATTSEAPPATSEAPAATSEAPATAQP